MGFLLIILELKTSTCKRNRLNNRVCRKLRQRNQCRRMYVKVNCCRTCEVSKFRQWRRPRRRQQWWRFFCKLAPKCFVICRVRLPHLSRARLPPTVREGKPTVPVLKSVEIHFVFALLRQNHSHNSIFSIESWIISCLIYLIYSTENVHLEAECVCFVDIAGRFDW